MVLRSWLGFISWKSTISFLGLCLSLQWMDLRLEDSNPWYSTFYHLKNRILDWHQCQQYCSKQNLWFEFVYSLISQNNLSVGFLALDLTSSMKEQTLSPPYPHCLYFELNKYLSHKINAKNGNINLCELFCIYEYAFPVFFEQTVHTIPQIFCLPKTYVWCYNWTIFFLYFVNIWVCFSSTW